MRVVGGKAAVDEYHVEPQVGSVVGEQLDVLGSRESRGLAGRLEVEGENPPRRGGVDRFRAVWNKQMRNDRGKPRAGTEHDPVGLQHDFQRFRTCWRIMRNEP